MTTTTNQYDQQAQAWSDKYSVSMTSRYLGHFKHFDDDTDTRDVYEVRIWCTSRPDSAYTFRYGQSINDSRTCDANDGPNWRRILRERERSRSFRDHAKNQRGKPPRLYDVLSCLTKYDPGTHKNFCGDYGYDTDSRKALDLYMRVQEEWSGVLRLCGGESSEMMRELREIE